MDFDAILIIGPQGSGKGTQGKMLAEKLGFLFFEMGAILRAVSKKNTPLGKEVLRITSSGALVPDDIVISVAKERLETLLPTQGVVFDGVPRQLGQANFLVNFLRAQGRKRPVTILFTLPREMSFERLLLRAKKEGRADDTREAIEARLHYYDEVTKPILEYLKHETRLIEIDASPSVPEIAKNIDAALGIA